MRILPILIAALLASPLAAQSANPPTAPAPTTVSTVTLTVVVRDHRGDLVKTLAKDDLKLTEDGHLQTILTLAPVTAQPLTVGLLIDGAAGSLDAVRSAVKSFLDHALRPADKAFLIEFGREVDLLADPTASADKLHSALAQLAPMGPGSGSGARPTSQLYDALFLAADEVLRPITTRKVLIIVSTGVDSGSMETLHSALESAQRAGAVVYAIALPASSQRNRDFDNTNGRPNGGGNGGGGWPGGSGSGYPGSGGGWPGGGGGSGRNPRTTRQDTQPSADGRATLDHFAHDTGGAVLDTTHHQSIDQDLQQIYDELNAGLLITYSPVTNSDSDFHTVSITAHDDKLTVQSPTGLYSSN